MPASGATQHALPIWLELPQTSMPEQVVEVSPGQMWRLQQVRFKIITVSGLYNK